MARGNSEQQWGEGARLMGMGSTSELLINVVTITVPKLLKGIYQNGKRSDTPLLVWSTSSVDRRRRSRP